MSAVEVAAGFRFASAGICVYIDFSCKMSVDDEFRETWVQMMKLSGTAVQVPGTGIQAVQVPGAAVPGTVCRVLVLYFSR